MLKASLSRQFICMITALVYFLSPAAALSVSCESGEKLESVFTLGRAVGASYYHLTNLYSRARQSAYIDIQDDYRNTFQYFNIIDIVFEDITTGEQTSNLLHNIRYQLYHSLQKQDLNETQIGCVRDLFIIFYENLRQDITTRYSSAASWMFSLGFYTAFQLESLEEQNQEKVLLTGFNKITEQIPLSIPPDIHNSLVKICMLEQRTVTETDLQNLKKELELISAYFSDSTSRKPLFANQQDLVGTWQGILINPDKKRYNLKLTVNEKLNAVMDIEGLAENIAVSKIKLVDDYFTFMFRPFGTEKLYIRFNAKLLNEVFSGEIVDIVGEKGFWVLARTNKNQTISNERLDTMVSYIEEIESRLANRQQNNQDALLPKDFNKPTQELSTELSVAEATTTDTQKEIAVSSISSEQIVEEKPNEIVLTEKIIEQNDNKESEKHLVNTEEKTSIIKKLKSLFKRLFSLK